MNRTSSAPPRSGASTCSRSRMTPGCWCCKEVWRGRPRTASNEDLLEDVPADGVFPAGAEEHAVRHHNADRTPSGVIDVEHVLDECQVALGVGRHTKL